MDEAEIRKTAFAMPITNVAYPRGPYYFTNREYLTITYETDIELLREVVPKPLEVVEPLVNFEVIRMPDSTGFGDYTESGQVIPVRYKGKAGAYTLAMYLDDQPPIAAGREIWGFPKKLAQPSLKVEKETLIGLLNYGSCRVATATMGFKYECLDKETVAKAMAAPNYLLKIIPDVDGTTRICELVEYHLQDIVIKGAWTGPASLQFTHHALAPLALLPVKRIVKAMHILTDLTLPYGKVVHDYLR
ncbi:MAG: acetoacetate decarboxylase [Tatlockia sp.]|nr:acetoacetate decarboxylase [Tatlockia sp.]